MLPAYYRMPPPNTKGESLYRLGRNSSAMTSSRHVASMQERERQTSRHESTLWYNQRAAIQPTQIAEYKLPKYSRTSWSSPQGRQANCHVEREHSPIYQFGIDFLWKNYHLLANSTWTEWRCNWTDWEQGTGRSKVSLQNWGYLSGRSGCYLWVWYCSTDYGSPSGLPTDGARMHIWGPCRIQRSQNTTLC